MASTPQMTSDPSYVHLLAARYSPDEVRLRAREQLRRPLNRRADLRFGELGRSGGAYSPFWMMKTRLCDPVSRKKAQEVFTGT
jgi:hypothetical protein